jgi:hypothetical protein
MKNYAVVLFKNKSSKKILKDFVTYKKAKLYFDSLLKENNDVLFSMKIENGKEVFYEIALIENSKSKLLPVYLTDELGRNVKVKMEDPDKNIVEISTFKKEEKLFDVHQNKKISVSDIIKKYLRGDGLKMIFSLNNKVIIQNDNDFKIFSLKTEEESNRFLDFLTLYFMNNGKKDCLIVKDNSSAQKKYLLKLLSENGFDKKIFYRKSTTHPR